MAATYLLVPMLCALCLIGIGSSASAKRGSCLLMCGGNGVDCPSGYTCKSNGCGSQCYQKENYQQPAGCSALTCDMECVLGYVRDKHGCDTCQCDYSAISVGY